MVDNLFMNIFRPSRERKQKPPHTSMLKFKTDDYDMLMRAVLVKSKLLISEILNLHKDM